MVFGFGRHGAPATTAAHAPTTTLPYTTGAATTGVAEPKAFHRQGHYRNFWHRFWQIVLPLLGLALALTAIALDIAGAAKIGNHGTDVIDPTTGNVLWNPNRYEALWIVAACLTPLILLGGLLSLIFSICAMRHEKNITRYNNDANQYQHMKRESSNKAKYLALIPGFLNQLLLLGLLGFYFAVTIVAAYRLEVARGFPDSRCVAGGVSASDCTSARRGHRIMLAGGIISLLSLLPFIMLNWAALSHLGSHQRKSNVMPPQAATMMTTQQQTTQVPAASVY